MVKKHAKIMSLNYFKVLVGIVLFGIAFCALMIPAAMSAYASNMSQSVANKIPVVKEDVVNNNTNETNQDSIVSDKNTDKYSSDDIIKTDSNAYNINLSIADDAKNYIKFSSGDLEGNLISNKEVEAPFDFLTFNVATDQKFIPKEIIYSEFCLTSQDKAGKSQTVCTILRQPERPAIVYCTIQKEGETKITPLYAAATNSQDQLFVNLKEILGSSLNFNVVFHVDTDVMPIHLNGFNQFGQKMTEIYGEDLFWSSLNQPALQPYKYDPQSPGPKFAEWKYCYLISRKNIASVSVNEMVYPLTDWQWNNDLEPWKRDRQQLNYAPDGLNMVISFKNSSGEVVGQLLRNHRKWKSSDEFDYHWQAKIYSLSATDRTGACNGLYESGAKLDLSKTKAIQIDSSSTLTNNIWVVPSNEDYGNVEISHSIACDNDPFDASSADVDVNASLQGKARKDQSDQSFALSSSTPNDTWLFWTIQWLPDGSLILAPSLSNNSVTQSQETYTLKPVNKPGYEFTGWKLFKQKGRLDASYATIDDPRGEKIDYTDPILDFQEGPPAVFKGNIKIVANFEEAKVWLHGQVLDPEKNPVSGAYVKFQYDGSADVYTSEPTNEKGNYALAIDPPATGVGGTLWVVSADGIILSEPTPISYEDLSKGEVPVDPKPAVEDDDSAVIMSFDDAHGHFSMFAYDVVDGFPTLTDFQSWMWLNVEFNDEGYFVVDDFGRLNYYYRTGAKSNGAFDYKHVVIYAVPTEGFEVDSWYINAIKLYANIPYKASLFKFSEDAQLYISVAYKEQVGPVPPVPPTPPDPPVPPGPVPPQPVPPVPPEPVPPFNPGGDIPATGDNTLGIIMLSMLACAGACCVFARKRKDLFR